MASATVRQLLLPTFADPSLQLRASPFVPCSLLFTSNYISRCSRLIEQHSCHRNSTPVPRALPGNKGGSSTVADDEDGVSLGTMKLPVDTDIPRFEILLFQWANSLCQGANLPLPVPLKVDKIPGGTRLGFITIGDGETEVLVYIDCLVFPATDGSGPMFRAIRNGPSRDQPPPGEPRIMRSLLEAIKKSAAIARV
ncbi:hypothetical protein Vadar_000530 [Vaccinium darrowii]|uniref:Uncharacterized protein n=1 Tax=Vaccinium darrowii TaxID=229202 RepID=A0ACB7YJB9_9ERIC|nr:hypothetical protein Vadar_000530 [Vaccinium darrowii]